MAEPEAPGAPGPTASRAPSGCFAGRWPEPVLEKGEAEAARAKSLWPVFARPGVRHRPKGWTTSCDGPRCRAGVAGSSSPASATGR